MPQPRRRTRPLSVAGARLLSWLDVHRTNVLAFAVNNRLDPSAVYAWMSGRTPSLKHAVAIERATGLPCALWVEG